MTISHQETFIKMGTAQGQTERSLLLAQHHEERLTDGSGLSGAEW